MARARTPRSMGMEIVFDRTYPPSTTEFTSVVRAMQAANPDVVFAATLPIDTAGIIRAANEIQFKPKIIGGAMLGLLVTGIKQQLGPMINGYISNEFYIPAPSLQFAGTKEMMAEYQKRAKGLGLDPLGYTYPPYAYAAGQVLAKAVTATKSLNDDSWPNTRRQHVRHGDRSDLVRPGRRVEAKPRIICIQFQGITGGEIEPVHGLVAAGRGLSDRICKSGKLVYPFERAVEISMMFAIRALLNWCSNRSNAP